ncbi:hypothetical protein SprV_0401643000 [Sparganum proliferum]
MSQENGLLLTNQKSVQCVFRLRSSPNPESLDSIPNEVPPFRRFASRILDDVTHPLHSELIAAKSSRPLILANTYFRLPMPEKATWMHPRSRHRHPLDYVLVQRRDRRDVLMAKGIPGADVWTDHRLLISKIRLQPRRRPKGKRTSGKLNIALLCLPAHHLHFGNELAQRLANPPVAAAAADENASVENRWWQLRDTVQSTDLAVLGHARRQHQNCFDDNDAAISNPLAEKNRLHKAYVNRPSNDSKVAFYRSRRPDLPPSLHETIRVVQQLSSGKAPGSDVSPAEVYKPGDPQLMNHLTEPLQEMWRQRKVPQDFKDATIVHLYKRKGNRQLCDYYRGISWLNIAGKIFARILLKRLNEHLKQVSHRKASAASAIIVGPPT